jgi:glycosyltransferase involved in cell wall biosynthesis
MSPIVACSDSEARFSGDPAQLRFSVVVPFLDESQWLPETLAALDRQTFPSASYELIFVDNGSSDDSAEIVGRHPRIRLLHEPRRDPYLARNRGIDAARGEYVVFLDADCPPAEDWLAELSRSIDEAPADVLIGALLHPDHSPLMLRCYEAYYNQKLAWLIANEKTANYFAHAGNMAVRRRVFAEVGHFEPMPIVGDTEIIHRLLDHRSTAVVRFVPRARVVHAEVDSVRVLLSKLVAIGGYTQSLLPRGGYRPISLLDKLRVTANTARRTPFGPLGIVPLGIMLGLGWGAYLYGRLCRRWAVSAIHRPE